MTMIDPSSIDRKIPSLKLFTDLLPIARTLARCGAVKRCGVAPMRIFSVLLQTAFTGRSIYMQMKTDKFNETFSKDTIYRFLDDDRINWHRFQSMLAHRLVRSMNSLSSDDRADVLIIDDSLYQKTGHKKTELVSRVFDHCKHAFVKGFRMMTLAWSDGASLVPLDFTLMASRDSKDLLGAVKRVDRRTNAGRLRERARMKATDASLAMLDSELKLGVRARYVLFDSWSSTPSFLAAVRARGLDVIAMLKKNASTRYEYNGSMMKLNEIYRSVKKRPGRAKCRASVRVSIISDGVKISAKIVCVRNRNKSKDWLAIVSTDVELSEKEIIRIYGKRWDIEVFFKTCKSGLKLTSECRSTSFEALDAHTAIVFVRYMLLSYMHRTDADGRSAGELFYAVCDEIADITFAIALERVLSVIYDSIREYGALCEEEVEELFGVICKKLKKESSLKMDPEMVDAICDKIQCCQ